MITLPMQLSNKLPVKVTVSEQDHGINVYHDGKDMTWLLEAMEYQWLEEEARSYIKEVLHECSS